MLCDKQSNNDLILLSQTCYTILSFHTHTNNPSTLPPHLLSTHIQIHKHQTYINIHICIHARIHRGGIHAYEEMAVKVYFFVTAPVWLTSVLLIYLFGLITDSFRPSSKRGIVKAPLKDTTKALLSSEGGLSPHPTNASAVQNTGTARSCPGSGAVAPAPVATTSASAASEDDVEQLSATQVLPINTPSQPTLSIYVIAQHTLTSPNHHNKFFILKGKT